MTTEPVFVEGHPALFLTRGERLWREAIRATGISTIAYPHMTFTVTSFRRGGQDFDIDNLAKPVLEIVSSNPTTVWATVHEGERSGVLIEDAEPPTPGRIDLALDVPSPRRRSVNPLTPLAETNGMNVLGSADAPVGIELAFDAEGERIGDFGFEGPIKPLIDALGNVLGTYSAGPRDYRVKELRIRRRERPGSTGVQIRIWLL